MKSVSPVKSVRMAQFAPALSLVLLTLCLSISKGFLARDGNAGFVIFLLTASLLSCVAALVFPDAKLPRFENVPPLRIIGRDPILLLLLLCLAYQWILLCAWYLAAVPLLVAIPIFVVLAIWPGQQSKDSVSKTHRLVFVGALLLFVLCVLGMLFFTPATRTDVEVFQRDSSLALIHGENPYTLTFPDIYGKDSSKFYGPGASFGGVLQFGFPYLPLTLLWVLPAQIILGDFRYAYTLAVVFAVVCIFSLRKNAIVAASAMLLLFSAPTFFVLQHGWTEPLPVLLVCLVAWASRRKKMSSPLSVGLLTAAKQYLILILPLLILLPDEKTRMQRLADVFKAGVVATIITLPFILWNPRAFFHSALFIQIAQPFRDSSLSYLSFFKLVTGAQPPSWPGFVMALIALAFCLWRAPRTTTGFVLSVALVMFGFIAFARQAFINYYFLIFGALCCATALANSENEYEVEALKPSEAAAAQ